MSDIRELQQRIKENPNDYKAIEEYAIALSDIGENEEAYKNFMYLKKVMPENPIVYYNLGIILEKLKDIDGAIQSYQIAFSFQQPCFQIQNKHTLRQLVSSEAQYFRYND